MQAKINTGGQGAGDAELRANGRQFGRLSAFGSHELYAATKYNVKFVDVVKLQRLDE